MTSSESAAIARLTEVVERIERQTTDIAARVRRLEDRALVKDASETATHRALGLGKETILALLAIGQGAIALWVALTN